MKERKAYEDISRYDEVEAEYIEVEVELKLKPTIKIQCPTRFLSKGKSLLGLSSMIILGGVISILLDASVEYHHWTCGTIVILAAILGDKNHGQKESVQKQGSSSERGPPKESSQHQVAERCDLAT